jgi:dolichol kinase
MRKQKPFEKNGKAKKWGLWHEVRRQAVHVLFGAAIIGAALWFGMHAAVVALTAALATGIFFLGLHLLGFPVPLAKRILDELERGKVIPGKGAMHYAAGALLLMTIGKGSFALAMIAILAFGDGASTAVGKALGGKKLWWNPAKSWAGLAAFVAAGFVASAFFMPAGEAFFYSVALAIVESLPLHVDDNLLIPVAALALKTMA